MVPVARELGLPQALKLGAMRGMNPALNPCGGGDGVVVADVAPLRALCQKNPDIKFLATFLSRVNQHEVWGMPRRTVGRIFMHRSQPKDPHFMVRVVVHASLVCARSCRVDAWTAAVTASGTASIQSGAVRPVYTVKGREDDDFAVMRAAWGLTRMRAAVATPV